MIDENKEGQKDPREAEGTEEFLKGLEDEGYELEGRQPKKEEVVEPPKSEEEKEKPPVVKKPEEKEEEKEEEEGEEKKPEDGKTKREPKFMPTWRHKVAEKNWLKEKDELSQEIETLKKSPPVENKKDADEGQKLKLDEKIKALVEKHGASEEFIRDLLETVAPQPEDISAKLKPLQDEVADLKKSKADLEDAKEFAKDFDNKVIPLIKKEYPEVSEEQITAIKQKIQKIAYTKEYLEADLAVIYKGVDDFRGAVPLKKKSAEPGAPGREQKDFVDFDELTEEQAKDLTPEKFIEYSDYMARQGKIKK